MLIGLPEGICVGPEILTVPKKHGKWCSFFIS